MIGPPMSGEAQSRGGLPASGRPSADPLWQARAPGPAGARLDIVALLEDLAARAEDREPEADRAAELARDLASELRRLRAAGSDPAAELVAAVLGAARQPVREAVLYERLVERGAALEPERFQQLMEELLTLGQVRVAIDHELPSRDPPPFAARFYRL